MSRLAGLFARFRKAGPAADTAEPRAETAVRWIVLGLGNPGEKYHRSRHNVGFMVVERIARLRGVERRQRRFKALVCEGEVDAQRVLLALPQTYYNLSGESAAGLRSHLKLPIERLVVVHDDLDLEPGRLQIKLGGGDAGNNGVRSIAESLGTSEFLRVRIGIGRPAPGEDSKDYVLKPMVGREMASLEPLLDRAAEAVAAIITEGVSRAMSRYNQKPG